MHPRFLDPRCSRVPWCCWREGGWRSFPRTRPSKAQAVTLRVANGHEDTHEPNALEALFAGLFAWIGLGTAASCSSDDQAPGGGPRKAKLALLRAYGSSTACWTPSGEHLGGRLRSEDVVNPSIEGLRIDTRFDASPLRLR